LVEEIMMSFEMETPSDQELLTCAEDMMNSDDDEALCAAMDEVTIPRKLDKTWWNTVVRREDMRAKRPWWQLPPEPVCEMMHGNRKMTEVYDMIDDCAPRPIHQWPDKVTDYLFGRLPLKSHGRYTMAALFWYNGINPDLAVEWFKCLGAFRPPKEKRKDEMISVIRDLNENMKQSSGRDILQRWHVFDLEKFKWVTCWHPGDEMLRGLRI
jgi:hypothetical protein